MTRERGLGFNSGELRWGWTNEDNEKFDLFH